MSEFPAWRYGPDGQAKVCNNASEVLAGWVDKPAGPTAGVKPETKAKPRGNRK